VLQQIKPVVAKTSIVAGTALPYHRCATWRLGADQFLMFYMVRFVTPPYHVQMRGLYTFLASLHNDNNQFQHARKAQIWTKLVKVAKIGGKHVLIAGSRNTHAERFNWRLEMPWSQRFQE